MATVYDPQEPVSPGQKPHGANLEAYREWLLSKRADGWDLVDIHGPMRRDLDAAKKANSDLRFQPDGVNPNRKGHWVMAGEILAQFSSLPAGDFLIPAILRKKRRGNS